MEKYKEKVNEKKIIIINNEKKVLTVQYLEELLLCIFLFSIILSHL